ncbi:MAG: cyclic pyranopterin monophosphate synthase MoaC [Lachnospiraceae bacterium]|nr:cyclic pyranopterin monophosphate synthase MoaC [Lachnospiraceae bacterium]
MKPVVLGIAGFSGSGKTTFIENLLPLLKERGLKVMVIKHDVHGFCIDHEGKDTKRFSDSGADRVMISSEKSGFARIDEEYKSLDEMLAMADDMDLVLVEGYKDADIPKLYVDNKAGFSHFDDEGNARMVDVGNKDITRRSATAEGRVKVNPETLSLIKTGGVKKGDVLTVAQIAGIMGAKRTPDLIPMCHPVIIDSADVRLKCNEEECCVDIEATVTCNGRTGVEMEALTACSTAALTVIDMCKSVQRDMVISEIKLIHKSGGVHGEYHAGE